MGNYNPCQRQGCQHDVSEHRQARNEVTGRLMLGSCSSCRCHGFSDVRVQATARY